MSEENEVREVPATQASPSRWLLAAMLFFVFTTLGGAYYIHQQRQETRELTARYDRMGAELGQARAELASASSRLSALQETPPPKPQTEVVKSQPPARKSRTTSPGGPRRKATKQPTAGPVESTQWGTMLTELAEHQKQIDSTRKDLEKARADLDGRISSTRDELNTTIARNHEELVELRKRGERDYFEFDLMKSKEFSRIGPLNIALRKAQTKKHFCDLELIVDDSKIKKNHINLYEPLFLYPADYGQPLEVVINSIGKNQARGYVSVPKFRISELAATSPQAAPADQYAPVRLERRGAENPQN